MRNFLSIYFPEWSLDIARKIYPETKDKPLILVSKNHIVKRYCKFCEKNGVREGLSLSAARAFVPNAVVKPFDPNRDFRAIYKLARWLHRFTPLVGIDRELTFAKDKSTVNPLCSGLILDLTGTERLYKEKEVAAELIFEKISGFGIKLKLAFSPTIGAAWAFSRFYNEKIFFSCSENYRHLLLELPLSLLRINHQVVKSLLDVGFSKIRDIVRIPAHELSKRFGKELLLRLDQAFGRTEERFQHIEEEEIFQAEKLFEIPLEKREWVVSSLVSLLESTIFILHRRKRKASLFRFEINYRNLDGSNGSVCRDFSLHTASSDLKHIVGIITPLIEKLSIPSGVTHIKVSAVSTEHSYENQENFLNDENSHHIHKSSEELLNTFVAALGPGNLKQVELNQSYIPEKSFSFRPMSKSPVSKKQLRITETMERPSLLFPEPEAVVAISLVPDYPPVQIIWRGEPFKIRKGLGPERISEEWWNSSLEYGSDSFRDYFKVQDENGRWLWVFRDGASLKWFVHGAWA